MKNYPCLPIWLQLWMCPERLQEEGQMRATPGSPPAGDTTRRRLVVHCGLQPWLTFLSLLFFFLQEYIQMICIKCYSVCAHEPMDACACVCKHMNVTVCVLVEVRQLSGVSACLPPSESGLLPLLLVCSVPPILPPDCRDYRCEPTQLAFTWLLGTELGLPGFCE